MSQKEYVPAGADLWLPEPQPNENWNTHTIHTHYFGFSIPSESISCFIYLRAQPFFKTCLAGVCIYKGMDNLRPLDCEHCNIVNTLPWPEVSRNVIATSNGLKFDFIELGSKVHITYSYEKGSTPCSFDIMQTGLHKALPRAHVMPGEDRDADDRLSPMGFEQLMHCTGTLKLNGISYAIDCYPVRDRSLNQVRTEEEVLHPAVGWSPMGFGPDLCFNQVGIEEAMTKLPWSAEFSVSPGKPAHYFGWVVRNKQEIYDVVKMKRVVLEYHPHLWAATKQEIEAEDDQGHVYKFRGQAIAMAQLPSWPNGMFIDSLYKWTDAEGRTTYCAYQEAWSAKYWRLRRGKIDHESIAYD